MTKKPMKRVVVIEYRGHDPIFGCNGSTERCCGCEYRNNRDDCKNHGKSNITKIKAWLTMYDRTIAGKEPLTIKRLWWETGIPLHSLSKLVPLWFRWRYLELLNDTWPMKVRLSQRGRDWVKRWYSLMPIDRITREIEEWQKTRPPFPVRKKRLYG